MLKYKMTARKFLFKDGKMLIDTFVNALNKMFLTN